MARRVRFAPRVCLSWRGEAGVAAWRQRRCASRPLRGGSFVWFVRFAPVVGAWFLSAAGHQYRRGGCLAISVRDESASRHVVGAWVLVSFVPSASPGCVFFFVGVTIMGFGGCPPI